MIELKLLTDVSIRNAQIFICESSETISIISIISKMMLLGCGLEWMLSIAAIQIQNTFKTNEQNQNLNNKNKNKNKFEKHQTWYNSSMEKANWKETGVDGPAKSYRHLIREAKKFGKVRQITDKLNERQYTFNTQLDKKPIIKSKMK